MSYLKKVFHFFVDFSIGGHFKEVLILLIDLFTWMNALYLLSKFLLLEVLNRIAICMVSRSLFFINLIYLIEYI